MVGDCVRCGVSTGALQSEVLVLKRRLLDRDVAIVQLEAQMAQDRPDHYPQGQVAVLRAQCDHWQDKYDRLLEAHKRLQKVNQGLEDKLLRLVDRTESEKSSLTADTVSLTTALTTAAQAINRLKQENDRYKTDLNLAIQLLQCNPSKYGTRKLHSLPSDLQKKAKTRLTRGEPRDNPRPEMKVIKVPIPTFPPTAMVYSVNKVQEENVKEEPVDAVSAAIMAAVLEERERERAGRHCPTCSCSSHPRDPTDHLPRNSDDGDMNGNGFRVGQHEDGPMGHEPREDGSYESRGDGPREGRPWGDVPKGSGPAAGDMLRVDRSKSSGGNGWAMPGGDVRPGLEGREGWKGCGSAGEGGAKLPVNVVDVGTQVLPSYIGETGKVQSTCIYCHSAKTPSNEKLHPSAGKSPGLTLHTRSKSQPVNRVSGGAGQTQFGLGQGDQGRAGQDGKTRDPDPASPTPKSPLTFGTHPAWDWAAGAGGGDDSPSTPSTTPSSLVSASLSYESETSNGTSPQDSPLRPPLLPMPKQTHTRSMPLPTDTYRQATDTYRHTDIQRQSSTILKHVDDSRHILDIHKEATNNHKYPSNHGQGVDANRQAADTLRQTTDAHKHSDTHRQGTVSYRHSENHRQITDTSRQIMDTTRQATDTHKQTTDNHKHSTDSYRQTTGNHRHTETLRHSTDSHKQTPDTSRLATTDSRNNHTVHHKSAGESKINNVSGQGRYASVPHTPMAGTPGNSPLNHNHINSHSHLINSHLGRHQPGYSNPGGQVRSFGGSNNHHVATYKVPFNARSPYQDVFTPPIHRSPTSSRSPPSARSNSQQKEVPHRSWSPEPVVASSTATASSTETTL